MTSDELVQKLGDNFTCRIAGEGIDLADTMWQEIETEDMQTTLALFTSQDQRWVMIRLTDAGAAKMAEVATDHSEDWQGLGVSILQRLIMETLLGVKDMPKPKYVHLISEVVESHHQDQEDYPLTALVMPATLDHIRSISEHQERMPAKSTYFYPKLLSGLVFNPLE